MAPRFPKCFHAARLTRLRKLDLLDTADFDLKALADRRIGGSAELLAAGFRAFGEAPYGL